MKLDPQERQNVGAQKELAVGLARRASEGDQGSVSRTGGSQKKRKAVVRTESADTQEYRSCQVNDMDVDMDENSEELSFIWQHPHRTNRTCVSCTSCFFLSQQYWTFAFAFGPQWAGLCFVFRAQIFLNLVGVTAVLGRVLVCPYHIPTLGTSNTPWFCAYRRHTLSTGCGPKYKYKFDQLKKLDDEKRSSHATPFGRECLKKRDEQLHFQHFLEYLQISFTTP